MYLHYYNRLFQWLYPYRVWSKKASEKVIYLTFDDGPIPEVTEFVLDELKNVNAKATFFCVGDNIRKYPEIYKRLLKEGHRSANHTFNHLNGRKTTKDEYVRNAKKCSELIVDDFEGKMLFRPPYGRIKGDQFRALKRDYEVVMWNVLSADFDPNLSKEKCLKKTIRYTKKGAIVVFHDNVKTMGKLRWVLPKYLNHFSKLGYKFKCL